MKVLIIDDERPFADALAKAVSLWGHQASVAYSAMEGWGAAERGRYDLVLLDVQMPDRNGLDLLPELKQSWPDLSVVVLTGLGSTRGAVTALRRGAVNYLEKPFETAELKAFLAAEGERRRHRLPCAEAGPEADAPLTSPAMQAAYRRVESVAGQDIGVLITGETGTGKQPLARLIHARSRRSQGPWLELNCATLSPNLAEAALFGHEPGAYTDARGRKPGLFELARGGTLFLDEVGELSLEVQAKLLKVLEQRQALRLGGVKPVALDFRLIAATNRDLAAETHLGRFRPDLYYRLSAFPIHLPPLRERREDIAVLAAHFHASARRAFGRPGPELGPEDLRALDRAPWPGNARQLKNLVERSVLEDLPVASLLDEPAAGPGRPDKLAALAVGDLQRLLEDFRWNKSELARFLGVSRPTLHKAIRRQGLRQD